MDSLVMIRGVGNTINNIEWQVYSEELGLMKCGVINGLEIPKFDTLTGITLNYQECFGQPCTFSRGQVKKNGNYCLTET